MTHTQASAELALRLWPQAEIIPYPERRYGMVSVETEEDCFFFRPFTNRDDAAKLVAFMSSQDEPDDFINRLLWRISEHGQNKKEYGLLLATPDQITRAVCAALGIQLDDARV